MKTLTVSSGGLYSPESILNFIQHHQFGLLTCVVLAVVAGWMLADHS